MQRSAGQHSAIKRRVGEHTIGRVGMVKKAENVAIGGRMVQWGAATYRGAKASKHCDFANAAQQSTTPALVTLCSTLWVTGIP